MTVPPSEVLDQLRERGFTAEVENETLWIRPASALTSSDRAAIAEHKPALVAILRLRAAIARARAYMHEIECAPWCGKLVTDYAPITAELVAAEIAAEALGLNAEGSEAP